VDFLAGAGIRLDPAKMRTKCFGSIIVDKRSILGVVFDLVILLTSLIDLSNSIIEGEVTGSSAVESISLLVAIA
jgi:hypothetical protein